MYHRHISNMVSEECFEDLYFMISKRRHTSLQKHCITIKMRKRNKISIWLDSKPELEQFHVAWVVWRQIQRNQIKTLGTREVDTSEEKNKNCRKEIGNRRKMQGNKMKEKRIITEVVKTHGGARVSEEDIT